MRSRIACRDHLGWWWRRLVGCLSCCISIPLWSNSIIVAIIIQYSSSDCYHHCAVVWVSDSNWCLSIRNHFKAECSHIIWGVNFCLILRLDHLLQKSGSPHLQKQIPPQAKTPTNIWHIQRMIFKIWHIQDILWQKAHSPPTFLPAPSAPCCSSTPLGRPKIFSLSQEPFYQAELLQSTQKISIDLKYFHLD